MVADNRNLYNNGMVYVTPYPEQACFLEYNSMDMEKVPLCNKPNCTHQDYSCISKLCTASNGQVSAPIIYHDTIYFFTGTENVVE